MTTANETPQPADEGRLEPTVRHRLVPTPGPWKAMGSKLGNDFGILDSTGKNVIGECFSDIRREGEHALHEAAANARLMAAAPTLLAYYRASRRLQMTLGHPDATAQDEREAEDAYAAASRAAADAVGALSDA